MARKGNYGVSWMWAKKKGKSLKVQLSSIVSNGI